MGRTKELFEELMLQESTNNEFFYKKIFCETLEAEYDATENYDSSTLI